MTPNPAAKTWLVRDEVGHPMGVPYDHTGRPIRDGLLTWWVAHTLAAGAARSGWGTCAVVHWTPDGERNIEVHLAWARTREQTAARPGCCQRSRERYMAGNA